jgi:hypothetical protein
MPQPLFTPRGEDPGTNWTGGWVSLRAGLDIEARGKILCLCWGSNPGHPVCTELNKIKKRPTIVVVLMIIMTIITIISELTILTKITIIKPTTKTRTMTSIFMKHSTCLQDVAKYNLHINTSCFK